MSHSDFNGCTCDFCTVYGPGPMGEPRTLDEIKATLAYCAMVRALESPMPSKKITCSACGYEGEPKGLTCPTCRNCILYGEDGSIYDVEGLPFVAKFVVREKREHTYNGEISPGVRGPIRVITVGMAPVTPNTPTMAWCTEVKSDENAKFWSATPSGAFELAMSPEEAERYPVGGQFKINFGEHPGGDWTLSVENVWPDTPAVGFALYPRGRSGKLEMQVQRPQTARALLTAIHAHALMVIDAKTADPDAKVLPMTWAVVLRPA